ncbi:MAG: alpha-galactosidase [bacterium]|nr:alpha-galactosidase [Candidatus Colisoma equi]
MTMTVKFALGILVSAILPFAEAAGSAGKSVVAKTQADVGRVVVMCAEPAGWKFALKAEPKGVGLEEVKLSVSCDSESVPPQFKVSFEIPARRLQHAWDPFDQTFPSCWTSQTSSFGSGLPLRVNFDDSAPNVLPLAVSDALNTLTFLTLVEKRNGNEHGMRFDASFFNESSSSRRRYETIFRIDTRKVFWSRAAEDGVRWLSSVAGRPPAVPPPAAYEPLYSSWYVFRTTVTQDTLEPELERAAKLGMKCVIVDNGWEIDRGDWAVNTGKFPDLRGHVAKVHALGLKYMLWFAVPHLQVTSPAFARFKDKCLYDGPGPWVHYDLDPRYPQVREHIVRRLAELMRDYDLDGFKLDFIDDFVSPKIDLAAKRGFEGCDYRSVPEAVERLLGDISAAVKAVKPDALIEFRQRYVGPVVRQYGNMLRANDCPNDFASNRYRTLALRVTSPGSAVHSDMLMWRNDDPVSEVMRQIWNVAFSVVQYSAHLADLPPPHLEAVRRAIDFTRAHRKTLLFGELCPHRPDLGYPCVEAESDDERIIIVYQPEYAVRLPGDGKRTILINATTADSLIVETLSGIRRVAVPSGEICPQNLVGTDL